MIDFIRQRLAVLGVKTKNLRCYPANNRAGEFRALALPAKNGWNIGGSRQIAGAAMAAGIGGAVAAGGAGGARSRRRHSGCR